MYCLVKKDRHQSSPITFKISSVVCPLLKLPMKRERQRERDRERERESERERERERRELPIFYLCTLKHCEIVINTSVVILL
jgi:hypothetical protein